MACRLQRAVANPVRRTMAGRWGRRPLIPFRHRGDGFGPMVSWEKLGPAGKASPILATRKYRGEVFVKALSAVVLFLTHLSPLPGLPQNQRPQEEQIDYYKKWLEEDVRYIIVDEERAVFGKLNTDDERDAFIEQFCAAGIPTRRRRSTSSGRNITVESPTPTTASGQASKAGPPTAAASTSPSVLPTTSTTIPADTTPGGRKRGAA